MEQTNIFIDMATKKWYDQTYWVWVITSFDPEVGHDVTTEYSAKYTTEAKAIRWYLQKGRKLRKDIVLDERAPSEGKYRYDIIWNERNGREIEEIEMVVPGNTFIDACINVETFFPKAENVQLKPKKNGY
jgi:hypothetical protein